MITQHTVGCQPLFLIILIYKARTYDISAMLLVAHVYAGAIFILLVAFRLKIFYNDRKGAD